MSIIAAIVALGALILVLEDFRSRAGKAGEEQEQIVLKRVAGLVVDRERHRFHRAVHAESEAGDPAEGGDVLVLLADRLAELVDLDMAGLLGELARMDDAAGLSMQGAQQRGREAAGRTEPGAGRNVGQRRDLDLRRTEIELLERLRARLGAPPRRSCRRARFSNT